MSANNSAVVAKKKYVVVPDLCGEQNADGGVPHMYQIDDFVIPPHYKEYLSGTLLPHGVIRDRIKKLAFDIARDCLTEPLTACCILKGGHQFFADLVNELKAIQQASGTGAAVPMQLDFIKVYSYQNDKSTTEVSFSFTDAEMEALRGKHLLLVEDIIDTGRTMKAVLEKLAKFQPASVRVVSLLLKRTPLSNGYVPDYVGFEIPDTFVVGYALDYNEYFRDLDHLCLINESGKEKFRV